MIMENYCIGSSIRYVIKRNNTNIRELCDIMICSRTTIYRIVMNMKA